MESWWLNSIARTHPNVPIPKHARWNIWPWASQPLWASFLISNTKDGAGWSLSYWMVPSDSIPRITTVIISLLPGTVLSVLCAFLINSSQHYYEIGTIIISFLQMRKLKFREVNKLDQGHTLSRWGARWDAKPGTVPRSYSRNQHGGVACSLTESQRAEVPQNISPHSTDGDTRAKRIWVTSSVTLPGSGKANVNSLLGHLLWLFHQVDSGEWTSLSSTSFWLDSGPGLLTFCPGIY